MPNAITKSASSMSLLLCVFLCGCAQPTVIEKQVAVPVVKEIYVPLDPVLLADCPDRPAIVKDHSTNGEMRESLLAWELVYGPCLEAKLESIRKLQPENVHNP